MACDHEPPPECTRAPYIGKNPHLSSLQSLNIDTLHHNHHHHHFIILAIFQVLTANVILTNDQNHQPFHRPFLSVPCSIPMMTSAPVLETSINITSNSYSQNCTDPDDPNLLTYDMIPGPWVQCCLLRLLNVYLCKPIHFDLFTCFS